MNSNYLKHLDFNTVKEVATQLIRSNGSTTTLAVKLQLRAQGYFALQSDVSRYMNHLYIEGYADYCCLHHFRLYFFIETQQNFSFGQN
jgi:hypothetical protein